MADRNAIATAAVFICVLVWIFVPTQYIIGVTIIAPLIAFAVIAVWPTKETITEDWTIRQPQDARDLWSMALSFMPGLEHVFVTCGGSKATLYSHRKPGSLDQLRVISIEDEQEKLYACSFSSLQSGEPLLLVAGLQRQLYALCIRNTQSKVHWVAQGHGGHINVICVHPRCQQLVLTASKIKCSARLDTCMQDSSIRLWNLETRVCVAIFQGLQLESTGHESEVLSLAWHPDGSCFFSGGFDESVRVWSLEGLHPDDLSVSPSAGVQLCQPRMVHQPVSSMCEPEHEVGAVDSVIWLHHHGLLLTYSYDPGLCLWGSPACGEHGHLDASSLKLVQKLNVRQKQDEPLYFKRCATDTDQTLLAVGTDTGRIQLWDLSGHRLDPRPSATLKVHDGAVVRQVVVSADASTVLGCCSDGTLWRFDYESGSHDSSLRQ